MYRLLIVEDEIFSQQALQCSIEFLYPEEFEFIATDNGLDALNLCQHDQPDIVLVDLNIPGISGLNLIRTLNDYHFPGKIVIITAHDRSKYIREAMSLGVVNYLLKPPDPDELKLSIDKCISCLEEKQEHWAGSMDSLFSYAQGYLIHDILTCSAPQKILSDVYGWAPDGSLDVGLLIWSSGKKSDAKLRNDYLRRVTDCFGKYFSLLSATVDGGYVIIFLHAMQSFDAMQLGAILYACMQMLRRDFSDGSLILSEFVKTYSDLYRIVKTNLFLAEHEPGTFLNQNPSPAQSWPAEDHFRLRQKFVHRLEEGQVTQFIQYLKRKFDGSREGWAWAVLFMEALELYSPSADLCRILAIFQSQTRFILLENYLRELYQKGGASPQLSKTQRAIRLIEENFSKELTQEEIAAQLGLTPTYFSSLFKKETGKSFPQYLAEFRVKHAISLLNAGERDIRKLSAACGCQNKKYFLEIFKKYSGYSITQYIQNIREKTEGADT